VACERRYQSLRHHAMPMQPGQYQQTLKTSFTVGGLGLHSGEYGE
jgi:hypothetical protein